MNIPYSSSGEAMSAGTNPETTTQQTLEQTFEKFRASWGAAYDGEGISGTIDVFYNSLYEPEAAASAPHADEFEGRLQALTSPLVKYPDQQTPTRAIFRGAMQVAINKRALYGQALLSDAAASANFEISNPQPLDVEQLMGQLANYGELALWTKGDATHQLHKMRIAGLGAIRRRIAAAKGVLPQEVIGVFAGDKFRVLEQQILPAMQERNQQTLLVIDDQQANLDRVEATVTQYNQQISTSIQSVMCWARYGKGAVDLSNYEIAHYNPANYLSDVANVAKQLPEDTRILLDYDGTLSDDKIRLAVTRTAILETLVQRQWI